MRIAVILVVLAACSTASSPDAGIDAAAEASTDAGVDVGLDAATVDAGTDAAPSDAAIDAPAVVYSSWTECGWDHASCTCPALMGCDAVAGGTFEPLGSSQARVCAADATTCTYVVFTETEGGGVGRRCVVPRAMATCDVRVIAASDAWCQDLFTCNLLMGDCPPDVMPGTSVIACR